MRGGMLRYFRPEGQFGQGIGGILRNLLKPAEPELRSISSKALGNLGSAAVNYGKRKAVNYAFGKMFGVDLDTLGRKRRRVQKGSGMKGRKKRKTARCRADIFSYLEKRYKNSSTYVFFKKIWHADVDIVVNEGDKEEEECFRPPRCQYLVHLVQDIK